MAKIYAEGFEFSYQDMDADYDRLWTYHFEHAQTDDEKRAFLTSGTAFIEDAYYAKGAYGAIVRKLQSAAVLVPDWRENKRILRCIDRLVAAGEKELLKRLLRSAVVNRTRKYWEYYKHRNHSEWGEAHKNAASDEKRMAFEDLDFVIGLMKDLGESDEAARYAAEKTLLAENKRDLVKTKPDPRNMDDDVFWEVIEVSRASDGVAEQVRAVTEKLVTFGGRNIQKFRKIMNEKMIAAYRWDLWALAYLAQDGCSDDGFEYFRAWLILQGRDVYKRALADATDILEDVPQGLGSQAEMLLYAADDAYTSRTGNVLKPIKSKQPSEPAGKAWDEATVVRAYPEIANHYSRD